MRAGARRNDWTVLEETYLLTHAGRIPKREICKHLKRSARSVRDKAYHLRLQGHMIDLRCYVPRLSTCPACGCLRSKLGRQGICEPCRKREQLATIHHRTALLLARLPLRERETYADTEAETESRPDPMPKAPNTHGMSYYQRERAREAHEVAMEAWTTANLQRQVKAAQKRKERIEKKVESMRLCE